MRKTLYSVIALLVISCSAHALADSGPGPLEHELVAAIRADDYSTVVGLLEAGANPNVNMKTGFSGDNPMCLVTAIGNAHYLNLFLTHGADIDNVTTDLLAAYGAPLSCAISFRNEEAFSTLLDAGANLHLELCPACTDADKAVIPFHIAIFNSQWEMMWQLIQRGGINENGIRSIIMQIEGNYVSAEYERKPARLNIIKWLRQQGHEVNPKKPR